LCAVGNCSSSVVALGCPVGGAGGIRRILCGWTSTVDGSGAGVLMWLRTQDPGWTRCSARVADGLDSRSCRPVDWDGMDSVPDDQRTGRSASCGKIVQTSRIDSISHTENEREQNIIRQESSDTSWKFPVIIKVPRRFLEVSRYSSEIGPIQLIVRHTVVSYIVRKRRQISEIQT
jgi:hypothetical protein